MTVKLNKLVMILSIGLILSLIGCIFFAFRWIDMSISYTYLEASFDRHVENTDLVSSLLESEWPGITEQELLEKLKAEVERRKERESVVVIDADSKQGVIWFNEVRFVLESGKLKKISM